MSLYIASLNSGSNANCYYVGNRDEAILVDMGLTCRETEKRLRQLEIPLERIKAIFISHEHGDHIKGLEVFAIKHHLPVYITPLTLKHSRLALPQNLIRDFGTDVPVQVGRLSVFAFRKAHDAADPHSFMVSCNGVNAGVFTDIGAPCSNLISYFSQCHAAFLEANYDDEMLANGRYPYHLKKRISGNEGHLSNAQAAELFRKHRPAFMTHLLLAHLSKENNTPQKALTAFTAHAGATNVSVASRDEASIVYYIQVKNGVTVSKPRPALKSVQISLF